MQKMTKAAIADRIRIDLSLQYKDALELVNIFFDILKDVLESGEDVKIPGLGNFLVRDKVARPGRNPKTKEEVEVSARRVVVFKPGLKLKERMLN